jgi:hypothetical protein
MTVAIAPRQLEAGVVQREDIGQAVRYFTFLNPSQYYVLVRFDWGESTLESSPDHVVSPYTNQRVITHGEPKDRVCWVASTQFPTASNPTNAANLFGFVATDSPIDASPASVLNVGLTDAPTQKTVLTNLESVDQPGGAQVIRLKKDVDGALRFMLNNLGDAYSNADGGAALPQLWSHPANDILRLHKRLFLGDPATAANRAAMLSDIPVTRLAANALTPTAAPNAYPDGFSYFVNGSNLFDGIIGTVSTFRFAADDKFTHQVVQQYNGAQRSMRWGTSATTWSAWVRLNDPSQTTAWTPFPTLAAGWGASADSGYRKYNGTVFFKGSLIPPAAGWTPGVTVMTLPAGFRPLAGSGYLCSTTGATVVRIGIETTGAVRVFETTGGIVPSVITLSVINYIAEG